MAKRTKKAPNWNSLSAKEKNLVAKRMLRTYVRVASFAAGKYNIVGSEKHRRLRESPTVETSGEDDALTATLRAQFVNLGRNGIRNNESLNAVLKQFKVNVIGTEGGKAYFDFGPQYEEAAKTLKREFAHFCSSCEFYDGMRFNELLDIILKTVVIGGDMVLAFDNHQFEDSGKILAYEPDSIGDIKDSEFKRLFGKGLRQTQGRIYTASNRFCGVIVSSSERGQAEFKAEKCHFFEKDPNQSPLDCDWTMIGHRWRVNQGRGTPPVAAPLGSFLDVDMLMGFEKEAAKHNSQVYAQLIQTGSDEPANAPISSPDLAATEFDESIDEAAEEVASDAFDATPVSFDELSTAGAMYDIMPANSKMELLDTKHPNPNMNDFIRLVNGRGGWAMGVAAVYVTGKVDSSYTGFRGEQLMTWPVFEEWQKFLETNVCDWVFRRWYSWAKRWNQNIRNLILPDDFMDRISWTWPMMREVNAVDAQTAWNMGLKNGTKTYREILGPDYKEKLTQSAAERKFLAGINFPHPANETASGQIVADAATQENNNE